MKALIVWHYYENGKLVGYSTTNFEGGDKDLQDCLKKGETNDKEKKKVGGEKVVILQQVILL